MSEVEACPECDATQFNRRKSADRGRLSYSHIDERYRCTMCSAVFDEPVVREARSASTLKGLAKRLHDASADDVGGSA